ncbi:MAG: hypothetical protein COZ05_02245 [Armatimonadetes bacterium CG_4_10_14_3_um_filter_59_10]|nr:MAG: hypothetical protein COZ05_02245 [Armatimonadetes bacterium CG_4_10_14_3_um_filter_59_10]
MQQPVEVQWGPAQFIRASEVLEFLNGALHVVNCVTGGLKRLLETLDIVRRFPEDFGKSSEIALQPEQGVPQLVGRGEGDAGPREFPFHANPFFAQPGVFERDGCGAGEGLQEFEVIRYKLLLLAMIRRDNVFGTAREDALRRDFTINGLFLDLHQNRVIDHVDGLTDLKARRIRTIGDPRVRIQEDPVRTIRAVKFATRLGFHIDPVTERAMVEFRGLLAKCSVARVLEEIYRLLGSGHAAPALRLMHDMGVLAVLLPELAGALEPPSNLEARALRLPVQDRTGTRVTHTDTEEESRPRDAEPDLSDPGEPTPEELQSFWDQNQQLVDQVVGPDREAAGALTWRYLEQLDRVVPQLTAQPGTTPHALLLAATLTGLTDHQLDPAVPMRDTATIVDLLVTEVCTRLRVSRRDREHVKQILVTQRRMVHRGKRRKPTALLQREYFLEAWHLFRMRCEVTGEYQDDLQRWEGLVGPPSQESSKRRRRPRRRRRRPPPQET